MSSIPLPALNVHAPEQPNLLQQVSQIQSLKGMMGQQQLQQQQIAGAQQENQMRAQGLQDQKAMTDAMQNWDGKDPQQLIQGVIKSGGSAQAVMGLQQKILAQKETYSKIAEQDATAGSKNMEALKIKNDTILGSVNALKDVPDDQLIPQLSQTIQGLAQKQVLSPQEAQQAASIAQIGDPTKIRAALDTFGKLHSSQSQQMDAAVKQADLAAKAAELPGQVANSEKAVKVNAGTNDKGITAEEQAQLAFEARKTAAQEAAQRETARHNQATESTIDMTNPQTQVNVAAVAQGRMKIQDVLTPRVPLPQRQAFLAAVQAANPNFNSADYDIQKGVAKSFTSGAYSQQLNAINTARNHMQTFTDLADALDNGNTQVINKLGNAINTQFGSDKATNFNIAKQAFSGEVGKAFAGANVAEGDRQALQDQISSASSPAQLKGVAKVADFLLEGKQRALKQTYDQGRQSQPNFGAQSDQPTPQTQAAPQTHTFSVRAWAQANPKGNMQAAKAAAEAQGYQVIP